ncbi:BTB domain-containing protein [Naegleria gruberi]|uniref:BTB domain-containing protein n=1 Tax=Naegleria gruberi TaxID=5762 RepID=D2VTV6_NAEGR|nr:BTB domain-containing protein [Naegleria gruberi]EFC39791.1 BTB domain-containing protein [Naegleria gruberi]|eukprot:XP_002672535.1 BTB domain-containing protein [Naegleria gruberi strain NEG-M]
MIWIARLLGSFWKSCNDNQLQRYFHSSVIINKQYMYIYGGADKAEGQHFSNSFVVYNLESGEYHCLNDVIKILRRKKAIKPTGIRTIKPEKLNRNDYELFPNAKLPKLSQHTMTQVSKCTLYIYGGQLEKGTASNSLYRFDIESMEWLKVKCSARHSAQDILPALYGHTTNVIDGTKMYIFGGTDGTNYFNDLMVIDTESNTWVREKTQGVKPSPRYGHTCVHYNNSLYIFGGGNDQHLFNDLYSLDLDTLTWKHIKIEGTTDSAKRVHHTANIIANKMIVFGGLVNAHSHSNDLMVLDLEHFRWDIEKPYVDKNSPAPPSLVGHSAQMAGTKLWIIGGKFAENDSSTQISNNVYTLETGIRGIEPIDCGRSTLTSDLSSLIDSEDYSDTILEYNGQFYHAHRPIIYARAPLLYRECMRLSSNDIVNVGDAADALMKKKKHKATEKYEELKQKSEKVKSYGFRGLLEYLYTDRVGLLDGEDIPVDVDIRCCIYELIFLAVAFSLDRLFALCSKHLDSDFTTSIPAPTLYTDMKKLYESTEKSLLLEKNEDQDRLDSPPSSSKAHFDFSQYVSASQSENDDSSDEDDNYSITSPMSVSTQDGGNIFSTVLSTTTFINSDQSNCDVLFSVGAEKERIACHRCILNSRSKFFRRMLSNKPQQQHSIGMTKIDEFELTGIRPQVFKLVLQYLYSGNVSINFDISVELLVAAEVYQLERLSLMCQSVIEKKIHPGNASTIFSIADSYDVKHLRETCTYFIVHNMSKVRKTNNYKKDLSSDLKQELKDLRKLFRQQEGSGFYEQSEYALPFSTYYHSHFASSSYNNKQKKKHKNKQKQSAKKLAPPPTPNSAPPVPTSLGRKKIRKPNSLSSMNDIDGKEEVSYLTSPGNILLGVSPPSPWSFPSDNSPTLADDSYSSGSVGKIQKKRKKNVKKNIYH